MHSTLKFFIPPTTFQAFFFNISVSTFKGGDIFIFGFKNVVEPLNLCIDHGKFRLEFWNFVDFTGHLLQLNLELFILFGDELYLSLEVSIDSSFILLNPPLIAH